jgi:hypothetical protein
MSTELIYELSLLLPQAEIGLVSKQAWHSLARGGEQLVLSVTIGQDNHHAIAADFERTLPDHDFAAVGRLVADIAVTHKAATDRESRLTVHALLLDD